MLSISRGLEWGAGFYIGQGRRPQLIVCGRYIGEEWYDLVYMSFTFRLGGVAVGAAGSGGLGEAAGGGRDGGDGHE
ncbi:hypothetical protein MKX03_005964 [Papaver bracteatum]|nr:hypothetical protein MKX03_005964 [Papaver bracteatum]